MEQPPYLSIVIPTFHEEQRIGSTLVQVSHFLESTPFTAEVIIADDGSRDGTVDIVRRHQREHAGVRLLTLRHRGKGHAVRAGMLTALGSYRYMCDADLSTPIESILDFLPPRGPDADVVIGSREVPGAQRFDEPNRRHYLGRAFNLLVRTVAVPGIHDTQCGFKCFRGPVADDLFSRQRLDGFGFDVEILYLARTRGYEVREVPVPWYYKEGSKVRPLKDSIAMFEDIVKVRYHAARGTYRQRRPPPPAEKTLEESG